jgi:hypothetical protein
MFSFFLGLQHLKVHSLCSAQMGPLVCAAGRLYSGVVSQVTHTHTRTHAQKSRKEGDMGPHEGHFQTPLDKEFRGLCRCAHT